jgi:hypothetical protein
MKITYVFERTHFDGTKETMRFSNCTAEEANAAARLWDWTPPRWWQWWRWSDMPRDFHALPLPSREGE